MGPSKLEGSRLRVIISFYPSAFHWLRCLWSWQPFSAARCLSCWLGGSPIPCPPINWPWLLRKSNMAMRNPLGKTSRNYKWMIFYCNVSLPASTANHWFLQWPHCLLFHIGEWWWMRPYVSDIFLPRPSRCMFTYKIERFDMPSMSIYARHWH